MYVEESRNWMENEVGDEKYSVCLNILILSVLSACWFVKKCDKRHISEKEHIYEREHNI